MGFRITYSLAIFLASFFLPYFISLILVIFGMIYFRIFWEGILILLISDLFFGAEQSRFGGFTFVSSASALIFLVILELIKKKLNLNNS